MQSRTLALASALVVAVAAFALNAPRAHAMQRADRLTYLTFNRSIALPGVTLAAGTYAFEVAAPNTANNVIIVRDRARSDRPLFQGFTYRSPRPDNWNGTRQILFGEAGPGQAAPILAWYPTDSEMGYEFIYTR